MNYPETKETTEDTASKKGIRREPGIIILIAVVLILTIALTALLTFSHTIRHYCYAIDDEAVKLHTISKLMDERAYYTPRQEEMFEAAIKAYVGASGDKYTVYYGEEQFDALNKENEGHYVGIGVTTQDSFVEYLGREIAVLEVVRIAEGSPAAEGALSVGDYIYAVDTADGLWYINDVGSDAVAEYIRGDNGTAVTVLWLSEKGEGYDLKEAQFVRKEIVSVSVSWRISKTEENVGIVSLYQFDLTTPVQFCAAIDSLREKGIDRIVLDLRDNGGGDVLSVIACASYFLEENDIIITAESKDGVKDHRRAIVRNYSDRYAPCSVSKEDIGKYSGLRAVVLVNENTASAAELLTAVFRDYGLAPIVGTKTFGKGSMQTLISLKPYGMKGGIKMTTHLYYPPSGQSYNGVGIVPDVIVNSTDGFIISEIREADDVQLARAIQELVENN